MSENHSINKEDSAPFDQPPIVCIGASAGGLDAFKEFFDHMPAETGIAFVLIPYLDPDHKSLMIEEIKSNGGLVIAQDPKTAKYEDMPQSAIETGMVDLIQPIKEMPDAILKFIVDPYICKDLDALNEVLDAIEAILESLPIGLGVNYVDSGEVTYLNEKFSEIYGWPKTDFPNIAKFFDNVVPDPKTRERLRKKIMSDIASKDLARMVCEDLEITTKKGEKMIKAEPDQFDLVISDMAMPDMPGDQLIDEILSINPQMPTMRCSGYSSRMSKEEASGMGIKAFVMKPLNKAELAKKVKEILNP